MCASSTGAEGGCEKNFKDHCAVFEVITSLEGLRVDAECKRCFRKRSDATASESSTDSSSTNASTVHEAEGPHST